MRATEFEKAFYLLSFGLVLLPAIFLWGASPTTKPQDIPYGSAHLTDWLYLPEQKSYEITYESRDVTYHDTVKEENVRFATTVGSPNVVVGPTIYTIYKHEEKPNP